MFMYEPLTEAAGKTKRIAISCEQHSFPSMLEHWWGFMKLNYLACKAHIFIMLVNSFWTSCMHDKTNRNRRLVENNIYFHPGSRFKQWKALSTQIKFNCFRNLHFENYLTSVANMFDFCSPQYFIYWILTYFHTLNFHIWNIFSNFRIWNLHIFKYWIFITPNHLFGSGQCHGQYS